MTEPKPSISVAMCTYNGERFLREQLVSIACQTRLPGELVVCDDGSTDTTPEIIEEFSRSAPFPVRLFRNPQNLGSTKNFEQAIGLCTGELIALCDQDDIWLPEKLARQAEMMERDPALGGVFSDAELIDDKSQLLGKRLWESILFTPAEQKLFQNGKAWPVLLRQNVVTGATFMLRTDMQSLFMPIPKAWFHDGWIAWMLTLYSRLALIGKPLIRYRIHANQQAGIESAAVNRQLSRRQRLRNARYEESKKILATARELEALEQRLIQRHDNEAEAVLPPLRRRINFSLGRGRSDNNRLSRTVWIVCNAVNYQRYEHGVKGQLWDIATLFA